MGFVMISDLAALADTDPCGNEVDREIAAMEQVRAFETQLRSAQAAGNQNLVIHYTGLLQGARAALAGATALRQRCRQNMPSNLQQGFTVTPQEQQRMAAELEAARRADAERRALVQTVTAEMQTGRQQLVDLAASIMNATSAAAVESLWQQALAVARRMNERLRATSLATTANTSAIAQSIESVRRTKDTHLARLRSGEFRAAPTPTTRQPASTPSQPADDYTFQPTPYTPTWTPTPVAQPQATDFSTLFSSLRTSGDASARRLQEDAAARREAAAARGGPLQVAAPQLVQRQQGMSQSQILMIAGGGIVAVGALVVLVMAMRGSSQPPPPPQPVWGPPPPQPAWVPPPGWVPQPQMHP